MFYLEHMIYNSLIVNIDVTRVLQDVDQKYVLMVNALNQMLTRVYQQMLILYYQSILIQNKLLKT